jgi:hypothetical protein
VCPVIGGPRQAQEIALPLAGPQCEHKRQVQMRWSCLEKDGFVVGGPDVVAP